MGSIEVTEVVDRSAISIRVGLLRNPVLQPPVIRAVLQLDAFNHRADARCGDRVMRRWRVDAGAIGTVKGLDAAMAVRNERRSHVADRYSVGSADLQNPIRFFPHKVVIDDATLRWRHVGNAFKFLLDLVKLHAPDHGTNYRSQPELIGRVHRAWRN